MGYFRLRELVVNRFTVVKFGVKMKAAMIGAVVELR